MRNKTHRFLSLLLATVLVLCLVPSVAFADFDNSTKIPDGEYSGANVVLEWSGSSGKTKMSVEKVVIADGKATAVFVTSSATMTHIYYLGHSSSGTFEGEITELYDPDSGVCGEGVVAFASKKATIPVVIGEKTEFSMRSTAMSAVKWMQYDYTLTVKTDEEVIAEVDALIEAIGEVTLESEEAITAARKAYDALSDAQKAQVKGLSTLEAAEAKLAELKADAEAAAAVDEKIAAIGEVTLTSEETIKAAREAYDALTDAQKKLVTKLADLEAAEKKLEELKKAASDADVAAAMDEQIGKIGEVTLDSEEAIAAARKAYEALTEDQKALVTKLADLEAAEKKLEELKAEKAAEEAAAEEAAKAGTELTVTNKLKMFKVVKAVLKTKEDGSKVLVFSLSGTGYAYLFKGTYEEACAAGLDESKWIKGVTNADGKLEFEMPVAEGETYIPIVAISTTYLDKAKAGENKIDRAFFPRQFELDETAKTLVTDDYSSEKELKITNNVKMFKPEKAVLKTVGGPNSNGYSKILIMTMGSDSFDKAYIGRASEEAGAEILEIKDRTVSFKLLWMETAGDLDSITDLTAGPIITSWHSAKNDKYYERQFTVSEKDGTLVIDEAPAEEEEQVILKSVVTDKDGKEISFTKKDLDKAAQLDKKTAVELTPDVRAEDEIDILWQKDVTVPEGTAFPVTLNFEVEDVESGQQLYVYHFEDGAWKLVGTGKNGKVSAKVESCSPFAVASRNAKASPQTGDSSVMIWAAVAAAAVIGAAAAVISRKRKEE